jgi:N-acetyl-1-D-myo-inositol-2-amino-2-deoxy-alpha-D-glucopyranoside deacetylase
VLTAPRRLLLVHAHPDDEALATGGTIARYTGAGVHVTVVTCTLGEEGEVIPEELRGLLPTAADQLGGYRVGELRAACTALGVADQRFLGGIGRWRDSGMVGTAANEHPRAFARGSFDEQVGALAKIIAEVRPQVVVGYDVNGGYGHPDHIRAHQVMMAAVGGGGPDAGPDGGPDIDAVYWVVVSRSTARDGRAALARFDGLPFPLPPERELPCVPDETVTTTVDITAQMPAKLAALRAHATQVSVWQGRDGERAYALADGWARPLAPVEEFTLVGGRMDVGQVATNLFGDRGPDDGPGGAR